MVSARNYQRLFIMIPVTLLNRASFYRIVATLQILSNMDKKIWILISIRVFATEKK